MALSARRLGLAGVLCLVACGGSSSGAAGAGGRGGTGAGAGGAGGVGGTSAAGSGGSGTGGVGVGGAVGAGGAGVVGAGGLGGAGGAATGGRGGSGGSAAGSVGTGGNASAGTAGSVGSGGNASAGTTGSCTSGFNIDVPYGYVQGTIKINGARPPSAGGWASLSLRTAAGDRATIAQTLSGSDIYFTSVVPGSYDLYYVVQSEGTGVPSNSLAKLRGGIVVSAAQQLTLDIDVPATTLSGRITVNGATGPSGNRTLYLRNASGDKAQLVWMTPAATYSTMVIPGSYDLYFADASDMPTNPNNTAGKLRTGIVVGPGPQQTLDIDIPATTVSGTTTVNGAAVPRASGYGWFRLRNAEGDSATLAGTFDATYSTLIMPGTYDLYYDLQLGNTGAGVPWNAIVKLQSGIAVGTTPLTLDIALAAPTVSGTITVNGAQVSQAMGFGNLRLVSAAGDSLTLASTSTVGTYSRLVVPGTYDLYYALSTLAGAAGPGVPSNTQALLRTGIVVGSGPLALDIDVRATAVSGTITVAGAVPSSDGAGSLILRNAAGADAVIGTTANAGAYTRLVVPGTYDLYYRFDSGGIGVPTNTSARLRSGIVVGSTPMTLNIDVPAKMVSGTFSLGGTPITGSSTSYGNIFIQNAGGDRASLGTTFSGTYTRLLIPGSYRAYWSINMGGVGVPYNVLADLGCFAVP
jgi:hypothetical protein